MRHKTVGLTLAGYLAILLVCGALAPAAQANPKIANFTFSGPLSEADQRYLGLEKPGPFSLRDVKAPYVVIEIMRTTCPHCLEQAPAMNQLYHLVAKSDLKDKVKFIGVGASDHESALKRFKATHKVPFPLVPDPDWDIGNVISIQGTPTTVVVDRTGKVLLMEVGTFDSAGQMFKKLKSKIK
jgi:peroxiredoxin